MKASPTLSTVCRFDRCSRVLAPDNLDVSWWILDLASQARKHGPHSHSSCT